jgi:phosphatidylserine decarboxylase
LHWQEHQVSQVVNRQPRMRANSSYSLLEIYKLVPTFLRNFEVELETPDTEWQTFNAWFVRQLNFHTKFKPRTVPADSRRDSLA